MTANDFKLLDEMEQMEAIWDKAEKIAERKDETYTYNLYKIDCFYVEEQIHTVYSGDCFTPIPGDCFTPVSRL